MIHILISSCDDCKLTLFCPSEKLEVFLEHFKKTLPTQAPTPHPAAEKERGKSGEILNTKTETPLLPEEHELGNGIRLKRNTAASNPRTFTKISTNNNTTAISTTTTSTSTSTSHPKPILSIFPTNNLAPQNTGTCCDVLPYLIKNFTKFMKLPKTLLKILSIFCVASWCVDVQCLSW